MQNKIIPKKIESEQFLAQATNPKILYSVNLIIPCYNEEARINQTLTKILEFKKNYSDITIILINDGSTDNTKNIIEDFISNQQALRTKSNIRLINKATNHGKGAAIYSGILGAENEIICFVDADFLLLLLI